MHKWHDLGPRFLDNSCVYWVTSIHKKIQSIEIIEYYVVKHKYTQRYTYQYTCTIILQYTPVYAGIQQCTSIYTSICRYTSVYTRIHRYTPVYAGIHQYTQVYTSMSRCIRIHQYSYISICMQACSVWMVTLEK